MAPASPFTDCQCQVGYQLDVQICKPICGDGLIKGSEGCDDGNLVDGDGCNGQCAVEVDFVCVNVPSLCSYTKPLEIEYVGVKKESYEGLLTFTLQIVNLDFPKWNQINFSQVLSANISLSPPTINLFSNGTISLSYEMDSISLEG